MEPCQKILEKNSKKSIFFATNYLLLKSKVTSFLVGDFECVFCKKNFLMRFELFFNEIFLVMIKF
jgi:hypothetical protein